MTRSLVVTLLLTTAACGSAGENVADVQVDESLATKIVNGTPSSASSNAVVLLQIGQEGSCSGTLIAPNLVITARHCLANIDETTQCGTFGANYQPNTISIYTGVQGNTPAALGKQTFVESSSNSGCGHDMGLLLLDRNVTGVNVAPIRLTKLTAGEPLWTSGFGENGYGQLTNGRYDKTGLKADAVGPANYTYTTRQGQSIAVDVPAGEIATGESTCFGDSGGPLFDAKGNVVGMTSRGIDDSCIDRPSIYSDTASHVAIIQTAATAAGHPIASPPPDSTGTSSGGTSTPSNNGDAIGDTGDNNDPATANDTSSDGSGDDSTTPKKKKSTAVASNGCSASSSTPSSSSNRAALGLILAVGLVLTRRRR